jgi:hypothetical protein
MTESRRNHGVGIFVLVLMIAFFSFFHKGKENHKETTPAAFSCTNSLSTQAVVVPEIQSPGADLLWIKNLSNKSSLPDSYSGRELILNKLITCCCNIFQLGFHADNPVPGIIFPQKVPARENDDLPSIS